LFYQGDIDMKAVLYVVAILGIVLGTAQVNVQAAGKEGKPTKSFAQQFKEDWKKDWGEVKHSVKHFGPEAKADFKELGKGIKERSPSEFPKEDMPSP
jgi:hypothetical protein